MPARGPQACQSHHQGPQACQSRHQGPQACQSHHQGPQACQSHHQGPQACQSRHQGPQACQSHHQGPQACQSRHFRQKMRQALVRLLQPRQPIRWGARHHRQPPFQRRALAKYRPCARPWSEKSPHPCGLMCPWPLQSQGCPKFQQHGPGLFCLVRLPHRMQHWLQRLHRPRT